MKWNNKISIALIGGLALTLPMSAFAQEQGQKKEDNKGGGGRQQQSAKSAPKSAPQAAQAPRSGGQQTRGNQSAPRQSAVSNASRSQTSRPSRSNVSAPTVRSTPAAVTSRSSRNQQNAAAVTAQSAPVTTRSSRSQRNAAAVTTQPAVTTSRGSRNQRNVTTSNAATVQSAATVQRGARNQNNAATVVTPTVQQGRTGRMNSQQTLAYQQQYNQGNNYGGLWFAGNTHSDWNHNQQYYWNDHNYRWYENGWLIIDGGYDPDYRSYSNSGSTVASVQSRLADQGYYQGSIDGDIGPETRRAISNYQEDYNLQVNGRISDSLLVSLQL